MAQIVPQVPSFGERLASGLGSGIQNLANIQLQKMLEQQQLNKVGNFYESVGLPRDLVYAPEKIQQAYLSGIGALGALEPQQQQSQQTGLSALNSIEAPQIQQAAGAQQEFQAPQSPQPPKPSGAQILAEGFKTPQERIAEKKMAQQEKFQQQKLAAKEKELALSETKKIREELVHRKKASRDTLEDIERFEELEKEGLPSAGQMEFYKNAGLDIPALIGASGEEYNKIAANFVRNAKAMFGNKLTDADLMQFLKTVPSLANSPEGRKRINANLKRIANLDIAAVDAYNEIVKKNGGIPPLDLEFQLDEMMDKKRTAIAKQFKEDLKKEVPAGESPYVTAILSSAGKLVGRLPRAAGGAAVGAATGARVAGPAGILPGAALGGLAGLSGVGVKDVLGL